ncbi:MAG: hypothetical protein ACPLKZ_04810 [Candidatus Bathyarchaeales archaeon]
MQKNKSTTIIALVLMLAMSIALIAVPSISAQASMNTFAVIGAMPNPVGVGQQVLITTGLTRQTAWPQPGWYNVTVTVTRPDGSTEILGPVTTDTTGITGITYTPTQVGTYYLQTNFPEQKIEVTAAGVPAGTIMKASKSEKYALIVQQEPRQYYPGFPLPSEYWTRPIDAQFREWAPIAGNWLNVISYMRVEPYNQGPETAHILWQMEYAEGGLVGNIYGAPEMDQISYEHGDAYEGKWMNPVIMNGILFFNRHNPYYAMAAFGSTLPVQTVAAVDIHTGELLWEKVLGDNERLSCGQIMYWRTMNMYGAFSYLWTTVGADYKAYDPFTGRWEYTIRNVPTASGTRIIGPMGEILIYTVNLSAGWMTLWNSTHTVWNTYMQYYLADPAQAAMAEGNSARWRPHGIVFNASMGIQWNVTIPRGLPGAVKLVLDDRIIGSNTNWAGGAPQPTPVFWGISTKKGEAGRLLFNESWTLPVADIHVDIPGSLQGSGPSGFKDGVFIVTAKELFAHFGFSTSTGKQLWGPTKPPEGWLSAYTNIYMAPWGQAVIAYGKLYTAGMHGTVNAYDIKTGAHLWSYDLTDPYTEQLFSGNWPTPIGFITDGKIYLFHMEHSANTPLPRGAPTACIDAETGKEIWRINGLRLGTRWGGQPIIGDGIIVGFSSYDNRIVALGKGPSATTVTASPKSSVHGSKVLVEGTVMDISPGTKKSALAMRFPNGVPAVADESMSDWMLYVYKQFPCPANVKGVEVIIEVLDPNNNYYEVARTTTDGSGFYSATFEPPVPGKYTVIARFDGTKAYYGSHAETAFVVEEAPPPPPEPTPQPQAPVETYFAISTIAIIIAIVIVGILLLRKR